MQFQHALKAGMSVGSIRPLYRRAVEKLKPHYTPLLAVKTCDGSDNLWLQRFFTFSWRCLHEAAVTLNLLESATPVKLAIVNGHIRAAVAHVCTAIFHQVYRLNDSEGLHMQFVANGCIILTHGADVLFADFPHAAIDQGKQSGRGLASLQ